MHDSRRRPRSAADGFRTAFAPLPVLCVWVCVAAAYPVRCPAGSVDCSGFAATSVPFFGADTIRGDERGAIGTQESLKEMLEEQSEGSVPGGTEKNARLAMLCTLVFPGLGQMYNERPLKAIVAMGVETFYLTRILFNHRSFRRAERLRDGLQPGSSEWKRQDWWVDEYKERRLDWIWWSGGVLVVLLIDSYVDAHLFDMNIAVRGIPVEGGGGVGVLVAF